MPKERLQKRIGREMRVFNFDLFKNKQRKGINEISSNNKNELHKASILIKDQMRIKGISRIELSNRTKISKNVLEAIENAWSNQLPENTYLNSMLVLLESELDLTEGSLKGIMKDKEIKSNKNKVIVFAPGNINIFTSWQGNLIYIILMMFSIGLINKVQTELTTIDAQPIYKISPIENSIREANTD